MLTEFENEELHRSYYSHPTHVAFSDWVSERNCKVLRVDYPLNEETLLLG